jgi:hypothetical protein
LEGFALQTSQLGVSQQNQSYAFKKLMETEGKPWKSLE